MQPEVAYDEPVETTIKLPPKMVDLFEGDYRYRCAYGGRGSGKTRSFALMTAVRGYVWGTSGLQGQILCGRERLNSLEDSSFTEIKLAIQDHDWLMDYWELGERFIRSRDGRIQYTFSGLRENIGSIKSKARILLAWVDEAEDVSARAWQILVPTVREEGSEIWVSWNPEHEGSPTDERFRQNPTPDMKVVEMNYRDNPWFPDVLEQERLNDRTHRPRDYDHIWEGGYRENMEGAYYALEMLEAKEQERICHVPHEKGLGVITAWDLGVGDDTVIWFMQQVGQERRIIDYYANSGKALDHYVKVVKDKPYTYDHHILPHDVQVRELGTGKTRLETLDNLGLLTRDIVICPNIPVDDGIEAVRRFLSTCWFDSEKCKHGIKALRAYRRDYNERLRTFQARPLHDWASHAADSFRYLAVGLKPKRKWDKPVKRNLKGIA